MRQFSRCGILIVYLVLVHAFLALVLWKSDFLSRLEKKLAATQRVHETTSGHYEKMLGFHVRMDENVLDKAVVFIGDSFIQGLYTDAVAYPSINYGIGGDTTVGVLGRLPAYRSLHRASIVVLVIGFNDMKFRNNVEIMQNYRRILQALPLAVPVVMSAVFPVNETKQLTGDVTNDRIRDLNIGLNALCSEHKRCIFVDVCSRLVDARGNILAAFQEADGVHLNSAGNRVWIEELRIAVMKIRQD